MLTLLVMWREMVNCSNHTSCVDHLRKASQDLDINWINMERNNKSQTVDGVFAKKIADCSMIYKPIVPRQIESHASLPKLPDREARTFRQCKQLYRDGTGHATRVCGMPTVFCGLSVKIAVSARRNFK